MTMSSNRTLQKMPKSHLMFHKPQGLSCSPRACSVTSLTTNQIYLFLR